MTIIIETELTDSHEIVLKVPTLQPSRIRVTLDLIDEDDMRQSLKKAGLLVENVYPDAAPLSNDEVEVLGRMFAGKITTLEGLPADNPEAYP